MQAELILYQSDDGKTRLHLRAVDGDIWLTQGEVAELFATSKQNINLHIKNILNERELKELAVVKEYLTTASDGKKYPSKVYNLQLILAIGYRVRSPRGTQFRQWATEHLSSFLHKGFLLDDERLKQPTRIAQWDYFDELLARIREIRASELRFYQKVRDLFALSSDYRNDQQAQFFFAEAQNKLLYAVCGKTAAELIVARADAQAPNMALQSWQGSRVRKADVIIAKNYLLADEIDSLNRLVVIFLEQAELRVKQRKDLTLDYWRQNIDRMLEFNDQSILQDTGKVSHEDMKRIVHQRYEEFENRRKADELRQADAEDLDYLAALENLTQNGRP